MPTFIIDLIFLLISGGAGFGLACYLKRRSRPENEQDKEQAELAATALARLQELTQRISADVLHHNSKVQEVSDGLGDGTTISADGLITAVTTLITANEKMQTQLASAEKRLQDQAREIESHVAEARTDALTGLNNRRVFDGEMDRGFADYQRRGRPISVMIIDVDHFKSFNDTHGHQAGDEVLRAVGRVLTRSTLAEHIVCRYGGEEFAIVFPGATIADAATIAETARAAIGDHVVEFEGKQLTVTASAGLAQLLPNESVDDLVKRADEALYASKEEGRNCGHGHDGETFFPITKLVALPEEPVEETAAEEVKRSAAATTAADPIDPRLDKSTGLSTMAAFRDDVERRLAEMKRSSMPVSLVVARIDNFDEIAAAHDKNSGIMLLRAAAQFFKATMRDMDHLARDEDDSFALLLPTATLENAKTVADRLRGAVYRCKLPLGGKPFQFTMSFGVAQAARDEGCEAFIQRCKAARCQAEEEGGNRIQANAEEELEPVG